MSEEVKRRKYCRRGLTGIDLATGERKEWPSVNRAAAEVGMEPSWLRHLASEKRPAKGWLCAYSDELEGLDERAEYLMRTGEFNKSKGSKADVKGLVGLRIDSRTVIYVRKEMATEEYAEYYRNKLNGKKR